MSVNIRTCYLTLPVVIYRTYVWHCITCIKCITRVGSYMSSNFLEMYWSWSRSRGRHCLHWLYTGRCKLDVPNCQSYLKYYLWNCAQPIVCLLFHSAITTYINLLFVLRNLFSDAY